MAGRAARAQTSKPRVMPVGSATPSTDESAGTPPAKRRKTKKEATSGAVNMKARKAGRLSALPSLPLDVLYEIFGHLEPLDLLNLARTTKSFRGVLLSRQSTFLWKSVLDAFEDANDLHFPCPEDVSIPVWVNLVQGGPYCDACGGRAKKILWPFRRRLCKGCSKSILVKFEDVLRMLPSCMELFDGFSDALPQDYQNNNIFFLRADVEALAAEVASLPVKLPSVSSGDRAEWKAAIDAIFEPKIEVWNARREHARECEITDSLRGMMRGQELDQLREARFQEVRKRLIALGYDGRDVGSREIREHKEVHQPKPLTDRVWTRIGPILSEVVEDVRDQRLVLERLVRQRDRDDDINKSYEDILVTCVPPSSLSLMPTLSTYRAIPPIAAYLEEHETFDSQYTVNMIMGTIQTMREWVNGRQASLRALLPGSWPRSTFTPSDIDGFWPPEHDTSKPLDLFAEVADLDLAVYTLKCTQPGCSDSSRRIFFGLDILAHQCCNDAIKHELKAEPNAAAHAAVLHILELLGLDTARTRPVDLDNAHGLFTTQSSDDERRPLMTWRQAVEACAAAPTTLQPATELERTYIELLNGMFTAVEPQNDHVLGCTRCSDFLRLEVRGSVYRTKLAIHAHVRDVHKVPVRDQAEGRDYFHFRRSVRHHCPASFSVPDIEARVAFLKATTSGN
ncbi:hypothetical protein PENSPDRAFT_748283 [Peniophora sp. CONT]|nr:hypothetical protein PENSPDRAFT_748283 [Peniophora sp. CONT]